MNKKIVFILLSSLLISCSGNSDVKIPDTVLSEEKMADVMVDIHLMEATMNLNLKNVDKIASGNVLVPAINIYKKHSITKQQFDESYKFYTENPEALGDVYQLVLNDLSKMQAAVMKK